MVGSFSMLLLRPILKKLVLPPPVDSCSDEFERCLRNMPEPMVLESPSVARVESRLSDEKMLLLRAGDGVPDSWEVLVSLVGDEVDLDLIKGICI